MLSFAQGWSGARAWNWLLRLPCYDPELGREGAAVQVRLVSDSTFQEAKMYSFAIRSCFVSLKRFLEQWQGPRRWAPRQTTGFWRPGPEN